MADVKRLIEIPQRLVDEGRTVVVVIEHHPDVFTEAGAEGVHLFAHSTPEQVATHKSSRTAPFLKARL
jgi:excinuclease ABC subunit A